MEQVNGLWNVFLSPSELWNQLKFRHHFVIPLVCLLLTAVAAQYAYFSMVDVNWFLETTVFSKEDMSPSEKQQIASIMSRTVLSGSAIVSSLVITLSLIAAMTLYLHLVSKIIGKQRTISQWFSFAVWGHFPAVITSVVALLIMFLSGSDQLSSQVLSATSLNALLLNLPITHDWYNWADTLSLVMVWQMLVMATGFRIWTGMPNFSAFSIATAPYIVVMGLWALSSAI